MVTNVKVFKKIKTWIASRERQWSFVGHLLREHDGMECYIIETNHEQVGKRVKGRHRMEMCSWMKKRMKDRKNGGGTKPLCTACMCYGRRRIVLELKLSVLKYFGNCCLKCS